MEGKTIMAEKMKKTVEEAKKETAKVVEEVKEQVKPAVEKAKKETEKVVEEVKEQVKPAVEKAKKATRKTAEKAAEATKKTTEKAAKAKAAVEKAAKKAVTGEAAPVVYVQFMGDEEKVEDLVAAAKAAFAAEHAMTKITDLRLYIKPEERAAYYVVNEKFAGKVDF